MENKINKAQIEHSAVKYPLPMFHTRRCNFELGLKLNKKKRIPITRNFKIFVIDG